MPLMKAASAERTGRPEQSEASESEAREGLCTADCRVSARVELIGGCEAQSEAAQGSQSEGVWSLGPVQVRILRTPHRTQPVRVVRTVGIAGRGLSDGRKEKGQKKSPQPSALVCKIAARLQH